MIDGEPVTALEISEMEQEFNTLKEAEDEKIKEIAAKFAEEEAERARIQAEEDERLAKERAEEEERLRVEKEAEEAELRARMAEEEAAKIKEQIERMKSLRELTYFDELPVAHSGEEFQKRTEMFKKMDQNEERNGLLTY